MQQERLWHLVNKKLAGEATALELQELEELLRQHPEMHYAIQHIYDLWELQPQTASESEDAFQKHLNRIQSKGIDITPWQAPAGPSSPLPVRRRRPLRYLLAALSVAALLALAAVVWAPWNDAAPARKQARNNISEISTRNGSRTRINLPDGSVVWLNAGSRLLYDKEFDSRLREVTLIGEAYFDVVKDPQKPFIIHAGKMDIKVLGTLFNVKSYPGEQVTEASLIRGSIEVMIKDRPEEKIILKPNEKIVLANQPAPAAGQPPATAAATNEPIVAIRHLNYQPEDSTIIETSWVENKLIFRDESFRDLSVRMERWYGVRFRFENEKVQALRFTGTFKHENIQQALAALKITGGFTYSINDDIITIH
jgi:transmembrane sensor